MTFRGIRTASAAALVTLCVSCDRPAAEAEPAPTGFDGDRALALAREQLEFGPRVPGSEGWRRAGDRIVALLTATADTVQVQEWSHMLANGRAIPMRNILARFRPDAGERVLYVTHWDTRPVSDAAERREQRSIPVPGANDNAGGVGLMLALAEMLARTPPSVGVDLLFVDGEDYGSFDGPQRDVLIGSRYFATHLPAPDYRPLFGVVWDMIADRDLRIRQEIHSLNGAPEVVARVWNAAADRGLSSVFVPEPGIAIDDDHRPLLAAGLRVIDVIDIDYPHHHKPTDTFDKISAASLQKVGDVAASLVMSR